MACCSDQIRALVCGLPFSQRKRRHVLMLRAYLDDSGSNGKSPFYVLAGFIATIPAWESFSDEWESALRMPPRLEYFKAREANRLKDQFWKWSETDRDKRMSILGAIIRKYVIVGAGVAVNQDSYDRILKGRIDKDFDNPYFVCFIGVVTLFLKYLDDIGFKEKIDFVFDEQGIEKKVRPIFDGYKQWNWEHADRMGSLDFRNDHEVLPLQAADSIAWIARKQLLRIAESDTRELRIGPHPETIIAVLGDSELIPMLHASLVRKYIK